MGVIENIDIDRFPKQGSWLVAHVEVCFKFDTSRTIKGVVVRDDRQDPYRTIIKLGDGRYLLSTECQFQIRREQ